ncbi:ATP-dependent Clp protease ATP-binding subunit [Myroides profundi]|uniref:ATP-dependent Clp protease ATP-binding subunit ClpA n=1 Tax=Myroides profundi TaxID=480520 RepID=A0AAJ5BER2_MYRPR|nr:ATP-dependent Clp protease ATP-binding subunit [Myroides profundi]AJH15255.1 ATP-dependent Clp protease ATP-binding subunit ClpB [Myroides profundi]SER25410.1 ATP-dependent Clp protease ATP-binding subunit ClpA [Myroides profundi]
MSVLLSNESVQEVIHIAKSIARENYNPKYSASHVLQALMHKNIDLQDFLFSIDKDPSYFYEWAEVRIEDYPKTTQLPEEVKEDVELKQMWENAEDVRMKLGLLEVTPLCLLASIVKPNSVFSSEQLKSLPLRESEVFGACQSRENMRLFESKDVIDANYKGENDQPLKLTAITNYCIDLTNKAIDGEFDRILGREKETRTLVEILGRRSKPNVILVGEPGVGKTALIEGFAKQLSLQEVPFLLKNCNLFQIDLSLLVAGTSYKGEIEDRLKKILTESKQLGKTILFIDEIHSLLDSKGNMAGVANLLKPDLARGEITVIGTTTFEEYRKIIEPELAFNRRFEVLEVMEPDDQTCVKMLESVIGKYESHHNIRVDLDALPTCVSLAKRYSKDKKLPDTAFDLLDRTMAAIGMLDELSESELESWRLFYQTSLDKDFVDDTTKSSEMIWLYGQLQNMISPILWGMLKNQPELDNSFSSEKLDCIITDIYKELVQASKQKVSRVSHMELAAVMAAKTGIPLGKIQAKEKEKLLNMEELLQNRVIGQNHALKVLSDAIVESRSGLNKPGQPIGSFFFLGPTGTGKTELAKSIAELLFNDEKAMIRFDMSEFKEEHSAALLYGAPPGYVGYEEGGMLVNKIRQQPYAVVLFDEIEKAHQSVFDVFLQIMDEGKIHDKLGKEGDFSNALILFTSNIGSKHIIESFNQEKIPSSKELMELMTGNFRPEFLARITEIVPFAPITETMAKQIFSIQLKGLIKAFDRLNIGFEITDNAKTELAVSGFNSQYGARQISGVIRQEIARPISKMIVREKLLPGQKVLVDIKDKEVVFKVN